MAGGANVCNSLLRLDCETRIRINIQMLHRVNDTPFECDEDHLAESLQSPDAKGAGYVHVDEFTLHTPTQSACAYHRCVRQQVAMKTW